MNIFTTGMPEIYEDVIKNLSSVAIFEHNFEQIIAMAKNKELDKLCIYMDVWNIFNRLNQIRGQGAAEKIHEIDTNIPILIWEGRQFDPPEYPDIPPVFQCSGVVCPIKNINELYIPFGSCNDIEITKKFFNNELKQNDIPKKEYLKFCF